MTRAGALPGRNPGTRTLPEYARAMRSISAETTSLGISTRTFLRVSLTSANSVFIRLRAFGATARQVVKGVTNGQRSMRGCNADAFFARDQRACRAEAASRECSERRRLVRK